MKVRFFLSILIGFIGFTSCNNSSSKNNEVSDTTLTEVVKKDTVVIPQRVLPDDGQVGVRKGAVFFLKTGDLNCLAAEKLWAASMPKSSTAITGYKFPD